MSFIRIIFFIIIIVVIAKLLSYGFKFLIWLFKPDAKQNYFSHNSRNNKSYSKKAEGTISIDHIPNNKKKRISDFKGGDYIDYEDINE